MVLKTYSKIIVAVSALLTLLTIGTFLFHRLEAWSYIESFYFSVTTLTTVGYGDLHPTNDVSRIFVSLYILAGVSITFVSLTIIGSAFLEKREKELLKRARLPLFRKR